MKVKITIVKNSTTADNGKACVIKSSKENLLLAAMRTPTGFPKTVDAEPIFADNTKIVLKLCQTTKPPSLPT